MANPAGASPPAPQVSPSATAPPGILSGPYRRVTLGVVGLISLMAFEGMAVATALPVAVADLDGLDYYAWAFTAFAATMLWATIASGESADALGPRTPLLLGVGAFVLGLLVAGLAPGMGVFVAGRAIQGLGAGAVIVAIYVVIGRRFPVELQPRAFSALAAAWVVPAFVGPLVAGWLAEGPGWRWAFLAVPVLVAPGLWLIWPALAELGRPLDSFVARSGRRRLALAIAVGAVAIQYAGQRLDLLGLILAAVGAVLLVRFLPRLLPAGTLRLAAGLPTGIALRGVLAGAFFGIEAFVPLYLVSERGLSATAAGLALTGGAIGWASGSWWQGRSPGLQQRAHYVAIGSVAVALSGVLMVLVTFPAIPVPIAHLSWLVAGLGMGLAMPSLSVVVLSLSKPDEQGANSASLQLTDALGAILTIAAGGVWFAAVFATMGATTFTAIFAAMSVLPILAAVASRRLRVSGKHPERQKQ